MSKLKDKMYNYEVNPPSHCLGKDAQLTLMIQKSAMNFLPHLYNMEVAPPATAWEKVNAALNPNTEAVVKPIASKTIPGFKICRCSHCCWCNRLCCIKAYYQQ